jgi:hypothetical protein
VAPIEPDFNRFARKGSVGDTDPVARRPLEDIAEDEKVRAENLELAVEIESKPLGQMY